MPRLRSLAALAVLSIAPAAHAANIDAECRAAATRLGAQYAPLQKQQAATAPDRRARVDAAVAAAHGPRKEVDAKVPGMYAWSLGVIEQALLFNWTPEKFAQQAYADCLIKFDTDHGA